MQDPSSLIELDPSRFHIRTSSRVWDLNRVRTPKTNLSMLRTCSTLLMMWTYSIQTVVLTTARVLGRKQTVSITPRTSKRTTSWATVEINRRNQCSQGPEEMVDPNSLEAGVNCQMKRAKYNLCLSKATGQEQRLRTWMVYSALTTLKINRTDPWVRSLRHTTTSLELVARWDQVVVRSQDRTRFEQEGWLLEVLNNKSRDRSEEARVRPSQVPVAYKLSRMLRLEEPSPRWEAPVALTQLDRTTLCPHKIRWLRRRTHRMETVYLVPTT